MKNRLAIAFALPVMLAAQIAGPHLAAAQSTIVTPGTTSDDSGGERCGRAETAVDAIAA